MSESKKIIAGVLRNLSDGSGSQLDRKFRQEADKLDPPKEFKVKEYVREIYGSKIIYKVMEVVGCGSVIIEDCNGDGGKVPVRDIERWTPEVGEEVWGPRNNCFGFFNGHHGVKLKNGGFAYWSDDTFIPTSFAKKGDKIEQEVERLLSDVTQRIKQFSLDNFSAKG